MAINSIRDMLIRDEGIRLNPYRDSVGKLTIGCGRNLDDVGISWEEAEILLENDIQRATVALEEDFPWSADLGPCRKAVLVSMTFNMGIGGLSGFHLMLQAAEKGDWETAAQEMLHSKWASQVGARAQRLAEQLRTGA